MTRLILTAILMTSSAGAGWIGGYAAGYQVGVRYDAPVAPATARPSNGVMDRINITIDCHYQMASDCAPIITIDCGGQKWRKGCADGTRFLIDDIDSIFEIVKEQP